MSRTKPERTPRYFPHMKVRGAAKKRMRPIYAIQRFGDATEAASEALNALWRAFARFNTELDRVSVNWEPAKGEHAGT